MNGSASGARTRPGSAAPRLASKTIETESLRGTRTGLGLTLSRPVCNERVRQHAMVPDASSPGPRRPCA